MTNTNNWGGSRTPGPGKTMGPDPMPEDEKRQRATTRYGKGYVEKAQAITKIKELPGWAHAFERALDMMIENDPELKDKLAEMGIIVMARG